MAIVKPDWVTGLEQSLESQCIALAEHGADSGSLATKVVWLAVSGGVDSCVLLDIAAKWASEQSAIDLRVVHVNHQLSLHADQWQHHVEQLSCQYGLKCLSRRVTIANLARHSLESQARNARYDAFFDILQHNQLLLLGQHLDDQVETVLMRLLRGSGPHGLAAMREMSTQQRGSKVIHFMRPLLSVTRDEIESYAHQSKLKWVHDESNDSLEFDRNLLRHQWFNSAKQQWPERWPGMQKAIARSAQLCAQQQTALSLLLNEKLSVIQSSSATLSRQQLLEQPLELQKELLRCWLNKHTHEMPSAAVLEQIHQGLHSQNDKLPCVNWSVHELRIHGDQVYFLAQRYRSQLVNIQVIQQAEERIQDATGQCLSVKWKQDGDRLCIELLADDNTLSELQLMRPEQSPSSIETIRLANNVGEYYFAEKIRGKPRQLKRWFKDWQIPPWHRNDIVGVFIADSLVAVIAQQTLKLNHTQC